MEKNLDLKDPETKSKIISLVDEAVRLQGKEKNGYYLIVLDTDTGDRIDHKNGSLGIPLSPKEFSEVKLSDLLRDDKDKWSTGDGAISINEHFFVVISGFGGDENEIIGLYIAFKMDWLSLESIPTYTRSKEREQMFRELYHKSGLKPQSAEEKVG